MLILNTLEIADCTLKVQRVPKSFIWKKNTYYYKTINVSFDGNVKLEDIALTT